MDDIVDNFRETLLEIGNTGLQSSLIELIQTLGSTNCNLSELLNYFSLFNVQNFPVQLLEALVAMTTRKLVPNYYIEFSKQ